MKRTSTCYRLWIWKRPPPTVPIEFALQLYLIWSLILPKTFLRRWKKKKNGKFSFSHRYYLSSGSCFWNSKPTKFQITFYFCFHHNLVTCTKTNNNKWIQRNKLLIFITIFRFLCICIFSGLWVLSVLGPSFIYTLYTHLRCIIIKINQIDYFKLCE